MASCSGASRSGCSPRSMSSNGGSRKPKSGSTSPSACSRRTATPLGSRGRAVAERIRGKSASAGGDVRAELAEHKEALDQELEAVRREVAELAERMDFAERLLAKNREGQRIGPGQ